MGKSKFPGKPSKLINKKRISVLQIKKDSIKNINKLNKNIDSGDSDNEFAKKPSEKLSSSEPPDEGGKSDNDNQRIKESTNVKNNSETKCSLSSKGNEIIKPVKKKTVTFKNILETSDDACAVKKVYNPTNNIPLVPIIKRECLSRSVRLARSDCIVRPSRLTEIVRNNSNNIDKLNLLKFKITSPTLTSQQSIFGNNNNNDNDNENNIIKSESSKIDEDNNKDNLTNDKASQFDDLKIVVEKRFVLPKRSVHSSRVIKPNKRFFSDTIEKSIKQNKSTVGFQANNANKSPSNNENKKNDEQQNNSVKFSKQIIKSDNDINFSKTEFNNTRTAFFQDKDHFNGFENNVSNNLFNTTTSVFGKGFSFQNTNLALGKTILREPRLHYNASKESEINDSSSNIFALPSNSLNYSSDLSGGAISCGICENLIHNKNISESRKYGIYCCEICRKFISKITKRSISSTTSANLQCIKEDGLCKVPSVSFKFFKKAYKERCSACWLLRCIKSCQFPSGHKTRLNSLLPESLIEKELDDLTKGKHLYSKVIDKNDKTFDNSTTPISNYFTNISNNKSGWNISDDMFQANASSISAANDSKIMLSLSNPLTENNSTFGGLPNLKKVVENPVFPIKMTSNNDTIEQNSSKSDCVNNSEKNLTENEVLNISTNISDQNIGVSKSNLRKKDKTTQEIGPADVIKTTAITNSENIKRQRIDLKGPRVKHVCRSASIVLGQTIATFSDENTILLENLDTPPRPESPTNPEIEITESILNENCSSCSQLNCNEISNLSPPDTPTFEKSHSIDSRSNSNDSEENSNESKDKEKQNEIKEDMSKNKKIGEFPKPITRTKIVRSSTANSTLLASVASTMTSGRNINSFAKIKAQTNKENEFKFINLPINISVDFWENYDPAEVSQNGFGIIVTEAHNLKALCFLCGSIGVDPMIFCACCCEPYHHYCVTDEYNLKSSLMDDTMSSILNTSINPEENLNLITNRLNWLCPRCTVCYTCNMSSGSKVKCQKCYKNYHTTCLGTSKRLLGADRPLICSNCLKCKSCATVKVTKFVGNLPMCQQCFKLRKKGNFCPVCQKCYEDNDFDLKMMECGNCQQWIHSRCEGLTDEQYNLLSSLPENIEFICKSCSTSTSNNKQQDEWKDAVHAEFKSGLLSIVKLLSKSRQACALLKLSPRKKPTDECKCENNFSVGVNAIRNLQFNKEEENCQEDDFSQDSENTEYFDENSSKRFSNISQQQKCFCSINRLSRLHTSSINLVDIKKKINDNGYCSLSEFHYDMTDVISQANCDDLMITYKEILSEAFPWFQNETKACTDALEEDMFDSCNFNQNSNDNLIIRGDQEVPILTSLPDEIEDCLYLPALKNDNRICMLCKKNGEQESINESRFLYCGHNSWVHINCAMWSAEVFEEIDGSLQNVHSAIARGRMIKCRVCDNRGATVGCNAKSCGEHYHFQCARKLNCSFLQDRTVYCPAHLELAKKSKSQFETNFEVLRPVYVELDRKRKKNSEPSKINFIIGSLVVKNLGKVFSKFSDTTEALIPVDFQCTRLYWSVKEPWKIVQYTINTSIQSNILSIYNDTGRNYTVDHSSNTNMVQFGLSQIARWHSSLGSLDELDCKSVDRSATVKQLLEAVGYQNLGTDETTTEEEPQNNADLLPPEIKDEIFEDLPHEILDGISMLDIFPKLMIYEDMLSADSKSECYFANSELSKDCATNENNMSENDENSLKDLDHWAANSNGNISHVEDALLSSIRPTSLRDEFNNRKSLSSDSFSRNVGGSRSQRSSSLNWSCKLDNHSIKRRKITKGLQESVLLSLGRRKDDFPIRRASQNDDSSNKAKTFIWTAAKEHLAEKLKISQLDGMDDYNDVMDKELGNYHLIDQQYIVDPNSMVKCDRCQCTYRTHGSYQRHLPHCEPLSTSDSESENASNSPESQSPIQNTIVINRNHKNFTTNQHIQQINGLFPVTTANSTISFGKTNEIKFAPITTSVNNIQIQNNNELMGTQMTPNISQMIFNKVLSEMCDNQKNEQQQYQLQPNFQGLNQILQNFTGNGNMPSVQMSINDNNQQIISIGSDLQPIISNSCAASDNKKKIKGSSEKNKTALELLQNSLNQNNMKPQISVYGAPQKPIIVQSNPTVGVPTTAVNSQPLILQQMTNTVPQNIMSYVDSNNAMQYVSMPQNNDFKNQSQYITTPTNQMIQGTPYFQADSNGNLVLTNGSSGLQMLSTAPLQLTQSAAPQVIGTLLQPQSIGVMSGDQMILGTVPTLDMMAGNPAMLLATSAPPMYYGLETIVQNTVMSSQQFVSTAMQGVLSQNSSFSATTTQVFQASKIEPIMEVPQGYVVLNSLDGIIQQPAASQVNIMSTTNLLQQTAQPTVQHIQPLQSVFNVQQAQQQQPTIIQHLQQPQQQQQQQQQQQIILQPQTKQTLEQLISQSLPQNTLQTHHQNLASKPTAKSSPIMVTKIQPQIINNPLQPIQKFNQNVNKISKVLTKAQCITPTFQPNAATISVAPATIDNNNIALNPSLANVCVNPGNSNVDSNQTAILMIGQQSKQNISVGRKKILTVDNQNQEFQQQQIQKKLNMIKPLNKISSVAVRPKIITKTINNNKTINSQPQLIAPKPINISISNNLDQFKKNADINKTKIQKLGSTLKLNNRKMQRTPILNNSNIITNNQVINKKLLNIEIDINNKSSNLIINTLTPHKDTDSLSIRNINGVLSGQKPNQQLIYQQHPMIQSITLPSSSNSIQLPLMSSLYANNSNIPTNIVNPIQQVIPSLNFNIPPITRPTNRVLPMQTLNQQQKNHNSINSTISEVIDSSTNLKIKLNEEIKDLQKISAINGVTKINSDSLQNNNNNNNNNNNDNNNQSLIAEDVFITHENENRKNINLISDIIKPKEDLYVKNDNVTINDEDTNMHDFNFISDMEIDEKTNDNDDNDNNKENETDDMSDTAAAVTEVKEKIYEILETLENDDDCPVQSIKNNSEQMLLSEQIENENFKENNIHVCAENHQEQSKQKENVNPNVFNNFEQFHIKNDKNKIKEQCKTPRILYEIQSDDGFTYKSTSVTDIWEKVFEAVQGARKTHGLAALPDGPLAEMCGVQMLGLKTNALRYLLEQLPGVEKCSKYITKYHEKAYSSLDYLSDHEDLKENQYGATRCEPFVKRSEYDMFSWLASRHRKQPVQVVVQPPDNEFIQRRGTGSNLPMAMKYRTLKETYKDYVGVFRSHIHGRGLYCTKDIEAGEMVIEYAGELIRATLTDKRERYYDSKGIGCYMFKIDDNFVVDATMRGNAARFINHSCEPNCYSKVVDILGHKHIIIFALRRIVQGEELTYDYKFPFEDVKIPCSCGSKKCRKYLN